MDAFLENLAVGELRRITCQPQPQRWAKFSLDHELDWQTIPFQRGGGAALPEGSGFYCFVLECRLPNLPPVYYPLYAGETENLKRRYRDYAYEQNYARGRTQVRKFLKVFAGEAAFTYAAFEADKAGLMTIEKRLNDALMPPYSRRDFSAQVKAERGAWQ